MLFIVGFNTKLVFDERTLLMGSGKERRCAKLRCTCVSTVSITGGSNPRMCRISRSFSVKAVPEGYIQTLVSSRLWSLRFTLIEGCIVKNLCFNSVFFIFFKVIRSRHRVLAHKFDEASLLHRW